MWQQSIFITCNKKDTQETTQLGLKVPRPGAVLASLKVGAIRPPLWEIRKDKKASERTRETKGKERARELEGSMKSLGTGVRVSHDAEAAMRLFIGETMFQRN